MNQNRKWVMVIAALFALGGIAFVVSRTNIRLGSHPSSNSTVYVNEIGTAELDSIESFIKPSTPEEGKQVAQQLADRAFSTPGLLQPVNGQTLPNEAQLRQLITDRILLMFNPDYDVFVKQVGDLLGRDGHEVLRGTMFGDEKLWYAFANTYKYAGVAVETTRATLDLGSVTVGEGLWGGRQTTLGDPGGVYGSNPLVKHGATVFNIGIPVMLPPKNEPGAKIMVLYATLSFVWDQSRGKWFPYRTAVYDPTGTLGGLPALWM